MKVPLNMTHLFQPLDLTSCFAKDFTKKKFSEWFSRQISIGLENGQELEDIKVDYRLSVLKPMHAMFLAYFYDYISSPKGKVVIDTVELGLSKLPILDPFNDIYPLMEVIPPREALSFASLFPQELESYKTK